MANAAETMTAAGEAAAPPPAPTPAPQAGAPNAVAFEHRFFKSFPDIFFFLPELGADAVAVIKLGENEVSLNFKGIRAEFGIEENSADGRMMSLVAEALTFVAGLRMGDPLPKEVTTREASWEPTDYHRQIAYNRLTVQLATWISGKENVITNPEELLQLAEDPEIKKKVKHAFEEAAERLGLGRERKDEIVGLIDTLSRELAYIECLREQGRQIAAMESKIQALRRLYGMERSILEIADPVARLAGAALNKFKAMFERVDKETAEIVSVLKNLQEKLETIRASRDDLYRRLMAWSEMFEAWNGCHVEHSEENEDLLRETYRFLAPRFLQVSEWKLVTKAAPAAKNTAKKVRVLVRGEKPLKKMRRW